MQNTFSFCRSNKIFKRESVVLSARKQRYFYFVKSVSTNRTYWKRVWRVVSRIKTFRLQTKRLYSTALIFSVMECQLLQVIMVFCNN